MQCAGVRSYNLQSTMWAMQCLPSSRKTYPCQSLPESCKMGRRNVVMKLICSLGHCECDGHTVHQLTQWRLTADWLAPRESDSSWRHSKVSSDWVPSYIKATRPVLEIFKMAGYFPDSPRKWSVIHAYMEAETHILSIDNEQRNIALGNYINGKHTSGLGRN
jgi:hypothetical protein